MKPLIWGLLVTAASLSLLFPVRSVWFLGDGKFPEGGTILFAHRQPLTLDGVCLLEGAQQTVVEVLSPLPLRGRVSQADGGREEVFQVEGVAWEAQREHGASGRCKPCEWSMAGQMSLAQALDIHVADGPLPHLPVSPAVPSLGLARCGFVCT